MMNKDRKQQQGQQAGSQSQGSPGGEEQTGSQYLPGQRVGNMEDMPENSPAQLDKSKAEETGSSTGTQENQQGNSQESSGNQQSSSQQQGQTSHESEKPRIDKGCGYFPISDLQFDVVTLVYEKSKALQAYDKYLLDAQACEEVREVFERIKADDKSHVEQLKKFLGKCTESE